MTATAGAEGALAGPWSRPLVWGLSAAVAGLTLAGGFELAKDSASYVDGEIFRTPVYPLLLAAARAVAGEAGLALVFVAQTIFGIASAAALALYLGRAFALRAWQTTLAAAVLLLPFYGPLQIGNRILTEALAYAIFLWTVRFLVDGAIRTAPATLAAGFGCAAAAVLTRPQFLFVYPVAAAAALWLLLRDRRRGLLAVAALAATVALGGLAERTYHLVRHGAFTSVPFVGLQLMAPALYLSEPEDAGRLAGDARALFAEVEATARDGGLLADANPSPGGISTYAHHYQRVYNEIVWRTLVPALQARFGAGDALDAGGYLAADRLLLPTAMRLVGGRPGRFARLYLSNVLDRLGLYYGLLIAVALAYATVRAARGDALALGVALVLLLHLANLALVALVEPLKPRYSFYTDGVCLAVLIVFLTTARGGPD